MKYGFAPIVPIKYLNTLAGLSHYQQCLAHWCVEKRYLAFYKGCWERGDTLILDNGACELKTSVPAEELLEVFSNLGGSDIVVIPDSEEGDSVEMFGDFVADWIGKFKVINPRVMFMVVPHTLEDLEYFVNGQSLAGYVGLNRVMDELRGRVKIIAESLEAGCDKSFHLLGFQRNPTKEVEEVRPFGDRVLGVDSSMPYRLTRLGRKISEHRPFPNLIDLYEKSLSNEFVAHSREEFTNFIKWCLE